jgi:hypothetical protein
MLAYVFWHVPSPRVAIEDYEQGMRDFHAALATEAPAGLGPSMTFALGAVPWLEGAPGYEDWYLVDGFAALGVLNQAAVSGAAAAPHDAAAAAMGSGIGGVMGHVAGSVVPARPAWAAWLSKPAGMAYEPFHAEFAAALGGDAGAWRRQMVLGPSSEYCVLADAERALPWPVDRAWPLRVVAASSP